MTSVEAPIYAALMVEAGAHPKYLQALVGRPDLIEQEGD